MFDVFYSGKKPGRFAHEREADSVEHAQKLSRTRYFWWIHYLADLDAWDWFFEPPPWQAAQRHAWPNQHQPDSGIYLVPRAGYTDTNYHASPVINHKADQSFWHIPRYIDAASIDSQWSPDPMDPPYIYEFPVEWGWDNIGGPEYRVPGATERKFVMDFVSRTAPDLKSWHHHCPADLPPALLRWRPNPADPPYDYVFGNQWHPPEVMPTVEYRVPGATSKKYISELKAVLPAQHTDHWHVLEQCDWDHSWVPDPGDPPYIYVFGNQWWPAEKWPTVEYHVPGAVERKYMDYPRAALQCVNTGWRGLTDHSYAFDWTWQPDPGDPPYVYVFGNQWHSAEVMPTVEWRHPSATNETAVKYIDWPRVQLLPTDQHWVIPNGIKEVDQSWCPDPGDPPLIYQFGTQWQRTGGAIYTVPGATEVKYVDLPRAEKTSKDNGWSVPDGVDTSTFDWTWHPDDTDPPFIYQFGTQHQRTGGPRYTVPGATDTKFVDQIRITTNATSAVIFEIDHMDGAAGQIANTVRTVRYFDNYRDTLIRLAKSIGTQHEFVWVCSSICDYTNFDFSWHPEQWQATMLHVFASNDQKFGDTFYMHVPTFAARAEKKELLEWYSVNFVKTAVPRKPMPVIQHNYDSQVDAVKNLEFVGPLAIFTNGPLQPSIPVVSLWKEKTKTMVPLSPGASSVIVPRVAIPYIKTQLYDYPYIDKTKRLGIDDPCDVVFISNGEIMAEDNWKNLLEVCPRAKRSDRVDGREAAYKTAAKLSNTAWFFAVFAKTEVLPNFKFDFQPDRLQEPKHYIFYSRNPLNGLEYGAMNINLYNRQLTLNTVPGLDFTLSAEHAVVPIVASISRFNTDPWVTWRSAFREVLKLKREVDLGAGVEIEYRLRLWCERAVGENAEHCLAGANDALEYYAQTNGDYEALRLSFDWAWLKEYYFNKYNARPWLEVV